MVSSTWDRSFECAPHATRSVAMALALSLNLVIVLFALRPHTPFVAHELPSQALIAAVLQPTPPVTAPPEVPTLRVVQHDVAPRVQVAAAHPAPIVVPVLGSIAPIAPVMTAIATESSDSTAAAAATDATIAYETATAPAYPIAALRAGIQGTVLLKVLVGTHGEPVQVEVVRGSGSRLLDDAARRHVLAAWRFHPAMRDGHAIEAWALVPVRFKLDRD